MNELSKNQKIIIIERILFYFKNETHLDSHGICYYVYDAFQDCRNSFSKDKNKFELQYEEFEIFLRNEFFKLETFRSFERKGNTHEGAEFIRSTKNNFYHFENDSQRIDFLNDLLDKICNNER